MKRREPHPQQPFLPFLYSPIMISLHQNTTHSLRFSSSQKTLFFFLIASPSRPIKPITIRQNKTNNEMKVILTGSTGFIGAEVLSQCLASGSIDEVICLSRRALPEPMATNFYPKLKVLILKDEDFLEYNKPKIWEMCAGAEACIWYII